MSSIYQQYENGNWWYYCYKDGKRIRKSLRTKDKKLALLKLKDIDRREFHNERLISGDDPDIQLVYQKYLTHVKPRITAETYRSYKNYLDRIIPKISRFEQINERFITNILDEFAFRSSKATANHALRHIKLFLNYCVRFNYITSNPIAKVKQFKLDTPEPKYLSSEQIHRVMDAAKEEIIYPVVAVAIYAGLRKGEIERLQKQDIKDNKIVVQVSKSGKFRVIPVNKRLSPILKDNPPPFSFVNFRRIWKRIKRKSGISLDFRFHDLRHTFASQLVMNGVDVYTVSKLLGHSDVKVTQIYAHLAKNYMVDAIDKLP